MTPETRTCKNCTTPFLIDEADFAYYDKIHVPPPTWCPDCRRWRRMMFRNERNYFRRKCDLCKKDIITIYQPDLPIQVYCQKCWWSDNWDAGVYAREYDFSRSFLEQFNELFRTVPFLAIMNDDTIASINSQYANDFAFSKNCYMTAAGWHCENVMYSYYTCYDKDMSDCYFVNNSQRMYECINCDKCSGCVHCVQCVGSVNCSYSYDLRGCTDCTMSVGLRNKSYCIMNEQYTKDEYFAKLPTLNVNDFAEFALKFPRKYADITQSVDSTGHNIRNSKSSHEIFYADNLVNCKYMAFIDGAEDCYDINNTGKPRLCYECLTPDEGYGNTFALFCWRCTSVHYSYNCHGSENMFGCVGMKKGSYSILNKTYSKEECETLVTKIKGQMQASGELSELFPPTMSLFAYNDTLASEFFPLTKEQALAKGLSWREPEARNYTIGGDIYACTHGGTCDEQCTTAFRVVPAELAFYANMGVGVPDRCPNCRYHNRLKQQNPLKLWKRECGKCAKPVETSYAPDRPEIIYCESCYNQTVV